MKFCEKESIIPEWVILHLKRYGNCCCGREIVKKVGKENIILELRSIGYDCVLRIVPDNRFQYPKRKVKYPKNAFYILETNYPIRKYYI